MALNILNKYFMIVPTLIIHRFTMYYKIQVLQDTKTFFMKNAHFGPEYKGDQSQIPLYSVKLSPFVRDFVISSLTFLHPHCSRARSNHPPILNSII